LDGKKQAEAARFGCKIGIQSISFPEENKVEFEWYVRHPDGKSGDGVARSFRLDDLDYLDVGDVMQEFCSKGRKTIRDALRGYANLFRVTSDFFDGKTSARFVQLREDGHYMDPVLVDSKPEQVEEGEYYVSIEDVLAVTGFGPMYLIPSSPTVATKIAKNPEARQAVNNQLIWMANKQAEAAELGLKIGVQSRLIQQNRMELEWCVSTVGDRGINGVLRTFELDHQDVGNVVAEFCSDGKTVIDDSLRGLANLFRAMRHHFASNRNSRFVQLRYDEPQIDPQEGHSPAEGHYMNPVLMENLPEQREEGETYLSIMEILTMMGWDEEFLTDQSN
jgi:hypothetical protein